MHSLIGLEGRIDRRSYLRYGVSLAAVKYVGDAAIVGVLTSRIWSPADYLKTASSLISFPIDNPPAPLMPMLALWALPFMWMGVSLTLRRARDAGWSSWWAPVFFVPFVNYLLMAVMCVLPTSPASQPDPPDSLDAGQRGRGLLAGTLVGAALGLLVSAVLVNLADSYGPGVFFGAPFTVGTISGFIAARRGDDSNRQLVVLSTLICVAGAIMAVGARVEGIICVLMALPILLTAVFLGTMVGRAIAVCQELGIAAAIPLLLVPGAMEMPATGQTGTALHEVQSAIEINAPPDVVWPHVVAFRDLPEPTELVFTLGIAYPQRATISGAGVGAVRYCIFSTGAFVEPITVWEMPRRLSFDVVSSPAPLRELSPWRNLTPPHIDNYLRSKRGEFRLVPLAGGRTRLEGSTWYQIDMAPEGYWQVYANALIHRIHDRVLRHIRNEVESELP